MWRLPRQFWQYVFRNLVITITYVAVAKLGLAFAFLPGSVSPVWAPAGIAVASVLLWGYWVLPGVWLGATLVGLITASFPTATVFGIGNTAEAALCAYLFHRLINPQHSFVRARDTLVFLFIAGLAGAIAATVGTFSLKVIGNISLLHIGITWLTWWLGDTTGIVLVTPWLLAWGRGGVPRTMPHRFVEGVVLVLVLLLTEQFIFRERLLPSFFNHPYFVLLFLIWGALRFGMRLVTTNIILIAALALWETRRGHGPFAGMNLNLSLLSLQTFLAILGTTGLTLSVSITERERAEKALQVSNRGLRILSLINQALVRATTEIELLQKTCQLVVDIGGYRSVWVGNAEHDPDKTIRPIAAAGHDEGYLESIRMSWADDEWGRSPMGTTIRTGQPVFTRDISMAPEYATWREEALKRGYRSSIAIPLHTNHTVLGAINFYADKPDAFTPEEVGLLAEVASDLAYGITALRTREQRERAEVRVQKDAQRAVALLELYTTAPGLSDDELYHFALDQAVSITNSAIGFLHRISDDQQTIILTAWNAEALQTCTAPYETHYPVEQAGNWVDCLRLEHPVVYNDYPTSPHRKGLPEGHPPVQRFMSIPVIEDDKVRIIFGVGNKVEPYEDHDVIQLQLVANELQKIIKQRHAKEALRESEEKYRTLFAVEPDALMLIDLTTLRPVDVNDAALSLYGYQREEFLQLAFTDISAEPEATLRTIRALPVGQVNIVPLRYHIRKEGTQFPVEISERVVHLHGQTIMFAAMRDITERKQAAKEQARLNRELRAINKCNQALLRAVDEQTLLDDICRIICDVAGYRMAWVGYAEQDAAKTIRPVAWAGYENGYIARAQLTWADTERGRGPAGLVIRSGEIVYVQDFATDPRMAPWREIALQRGYRSGIALPLKDEHANVFGVLLIYAAETYAITPEEIDLQEELAGDLAYGISALRARKRQQQTEEALRISEQKYSLAFSTSPDAISIARLRDGIILDINQAFAVITGYTREEIIGHSTMANGLNIWAHPDDRQYMVAAVQAHGELLGYEAEFRRKNGQIITGILSVKVFELRGESYLLGTVRDITEQKRAEEALRISEEKFSLAFYTSPDVISITRMRDGVYLDINQAFTTITGFTREEVVGRSSLAGGIDIWVHAEDRQHLREALRTHGELLGFEAEFRRKDGQMLTGVVSAKVIEIQGEPCLLGTVRDITERKLAEIALRTAKEYAENLIETANAMVVGLDIDGNITTFNQAAETITGYPRTEVQHRNWFEVIVPRDRYPEVWVEFEKLLEGGLPIRFENIILTKTGELRYIVWQNNVVREQNRIVGTVSFGIDITERKQAEETVRRERAYLASAIELLPFPILFITPTREVIRQNRASLALLHEPDSHVWWGIHLLDPQTRTPLPQQEWPLMRALHGEALPTTEWIMILSDGREIPVLLQGGNCRIQEIDRFSIFSSSFSLLLGRFDRRGPSPGGRTWRFSAE